MQGWQWKHWHLTNWHATSYKTSVYKEFWNHKVTSYNMTISIFGIWKLRIDNLRFQNFDPVGFLYIRSIKTSTSDFEMGEMSPHF